VFEPIYDDSPLQQRQEDPLSMTQSTAASMRAAESTARSNQLSFRLWDEMDDDELQVPNFEDTFVSHHQAQQGRIDRRSATLIA